MTKQYIRLTLGLLAFILLLGLLAGWENGYWDKGLAEPPYTICATDEN